MIYNKLGSLLIKTAVYLWASTKATLSVIVPSLCWYLPPWKSSTSVYKLCFDPLSEHNPNSQSDTMNHMGQQREMEEQRKRMLSGPRNGPRNAWTHIQSCPRRHVHQSRHRRSLFPLPLSPSYISLFQFSVLSHGIWYLGFLKLHKKPPNSGRTSSKRRQEKQTEREQEPGAEAGMRQEFCVRAMCVFS